MRLCHSVSLTKLSEGLEKSDGVNSTCIGILKQDVIIVVGSALRVLNPTIDSRNEFQVSYNPEEVEERGWWGIRDSNLSELAVNPSGPT